MFAFFSPFFSPVVSGLIFFAASVDIILICLWLVLGPVPQGQYLTQGTSQVVVFEYNVAPPIE